MTTPIKPTPWITWHSHDLPLCHPSHEPWPKIDLDDLCHTLAHIPRFNAAQTRPAPGEFIANDHPWSVAQHLLLCALLSVAVRGRNPKAVPDKLAGAVLMHDAHEAFLGDIISPVVWALSEPAQQEIKQLKAGIDAQLAQQPDELGVCARALVNGNTATQEHIKIIDSLALRIERARFTSWWCGKNRLWFGDKSPPEEHIDAMLRVTAGHDFQKLALMDPRDTAKELARVIHLSGVSIRAINSTALTATAPDHHPV